MPKTYAEIDSVAEQMKAAGAPDDAIQQYVQLGINEVKAAETGTGQTGSNSASPESASTKPARRSYGQLVKEGFSNLGNSELGLPPAQSNQEVIDQLDSIGRRGTTALLRYGVPAAVALSTAGAGAGPLVTSLVGGGSAALGEAGAQLSEVGQISDSGQIAKSGVLGAVPMTKLIPGTGFLPAAARVVGEGGKFAGLEALGETARQSINAGQLRAPYADWREAASQMAGPAVLGSGFAALGEGARKIMSAAAQRTERAAAFSAAGIDRPTLDLIFPSQSALVNRMAQISPAVAKLRVDATRPLMQQFEAIAEGAPGHEAIYKQLRPAIGKLDAMREEVMGLEQLAAQSKQRAAVAAQAAEVTPELRQVAHAEATVAELNAVNAKARFYHEANANLGSFLDYDTTAAQFGEVVDQLFQARKSLGAQRFAAAGVPANAPIFAKTDLLKEAKRSLERWRGTDVEKRILGAIEDAGGAETGALNLGQFRELRGAFTDRFAGMDPRQLASAEAAGRSAYGALTDASKKTIANIPGANLEAYNAAVGYWRDTAEAASSRYARPLLTQEPSESTFQTLAADLASGKKAEVRAFNDFVSAVAQDAPDVARLASQRLTQAVRNSFLGQARTATGIDPKKLTDSLLRAEGQFEIGTLGFGSSADIRRWADSLREFNVRTIGEADLDRMFADPQVQRALAEGKSLGTALRPAVAKNAFEQRVNEHALRLALGNQAGAAKAAAEATKAAEAAGLTLAERQAALATVEADPIMQAFAGKQTWGIPARAGAGGGGSNEITKTMLNLGPDEGLQLVRALRTRNPDLADQLQKRVLADVVQDFFRPANTPGHVYALNKAEVQRFFNPRPGSNEATHLATIRNLVGPDKFTGMEKLLTAVQMVHDVERAGGILSTDGSKTIYSATGIGRDLIGQEGAKSGLLQSGLRGITDLYRRGKYNVLANLAAPGALRDAFWKSGGNLQAALDTMGPQKFFLLARDPALKREVEEDQNK